MKIQRLHPRDKLLDRDAKWCYFGIPWVFWVWTYTNCNRSFAFRVFGFKFQVIL